MKKVLKLLGVLTLLFSLFASLGVNALEVIHAADTATVTLHKKMMNEYPDELQNTGAVDDRFDIYEDYTDGVWFSVYDVTNDYYIARDGGATVDNALAAAKAVNLTGRAALVTGETDEDGEVDFTLDKKDTDGRHKVYLFVETPKDGLTVAANMLLMFPVYPMNTDGTYMDVELDDIHLYPKNIVSKGDLEVTKRKTADNTLLNDAEFIVQSNVTNRYLTGVANGYYTWGARENAAKFLTGHQYGIGPTNITDIASSNGILRINGLIPGSYKLIETNSPTNTAIIDSENNRDFTIVPGATSATTLTVMNDTIIVNKDIVGSKRDYNVGDLIPYEIKVNIPQGMGDKLDATNYKHPSMIITDAPAAGLHFNKILEIKAGDKVIPLEDVTLTPSGNGFIMTILANHLESEEGKELTITYNMFLDGSAAPDLAYVNTATVTTSRITDNVVGPEVFTGGMRFIKKDRDAQNNNLAGATFVVRDGVGEAALYLAVDANNKVTWVTDEIDAKKFVTLADGLIDIRGLDYGDYYLEETIAPADYVVVEKVIPFKIGAGTYGAPTALVNPTTVVNIRKGRLPQTGGSGIIGIVGLGLVLVTTTGGYYIKRRKDA